MSAERLLRGTVKPRHLLVTTAGYCMSALGHKQTFAPQNVMSALPSKADMCGLGPKADKRALTICVGLLIQIDASALTLSGLTFEICSHIPYKELR